jgi:hypothetical protein
MPGRLSEAQREILARAAKDWNGGIRLDDKRQLNIADRLSKRGLMRIAIPGYGPDFYITPAGRAALSTLPPHAKE